MTLTVRFTIFMIKHQSQMYSVGRLKCFWRVRSKVLCEGSGKRRVGIRREKKKKRFYQISVVISLVCFHCDFILIHPHKIYHEMAEIIPGPMGLYVAELY